MSIADTTDDRVIEALRSMPERQMHVEIVQPLLEACGATHVVYCHGSAERGKDFIYVCRDPFGNQRLTVCQVKNERLTGRSSSSSSVSTVLHQLIQCRTTKVLNPVTSNQKELPQEVVPITTYSLPDAPLADADDLLNKVRTECVIIGPEKLAELLRERLPDLYAELPFPGGTLGKAVLRYVSAHQEAAAFDLSTYRPVDQFYVNIGLMGQDTIFDRIADGYLRCSTQMGYDSLPRSRYSMIMSRYSVISKFMKNIPLFQLVASKTNKNATDDAYGSGARASAEDSHEDNASPEVTDGENVSVKLPDDDHEKSVSLNVQIRNIFLERFLTMLDDYFSARSVLDDPKAFAETLQLIHYADRLVDELSRSFQDLLKPVPSNQAKRAYNFRYKAVKPEFLLEVSDNVCIVGDAGAGKTSMARILAQKAVASGTNCVYFPCSRIQRDDCHLLTEIRSFLLSINAITPSTNFDDLLDSVDLFILDGCDEAATYKTTLGAEIQALVYRSKVSVTVNLKSGGQASHSAGPVQGCQYQKTR